MSTIENNKLIAEFMGLNIDRGVQADYMEHELKYYTFWDWLMPVIKKIDAYACEQMDFSDYDDYRNKYGFIHNTFLCNDIREVYNQVVEFIKEYNNQTLTIK